MAKKFDFKNIKEHSLTKPRDLAWSNWASFEKVGDYVEGIIRDAFFRPAEGIFKDQRGITLEQEDGTLINVGIKRHDFVLNKTDGMRVGDPLRVELVELKPSDLGNPTKIFGFYGKNLPENAGNPTVKSLDDESRGEGGASAPAPADVNADDVPFPSSEDKEPA